MYIQIGCFTWESIISHMHLKVAMANGATATFNNRGSVEEQLAEIKSITSGNFARIVDSTAYGYEIMVKALETCSTATTQFLTTVDDW